MNSRWTRRLSLALGLLVGNAQADELQWRPAAPQPAMAVLPGNAGPAVTLGRAAPLTQADQHPEPASVASLGTPVAMSPAVVQDPRVKPASFSGFAVDRPLVRAKAADGPSRPMPVGKPEGLGPPREDLSYTDQAPSFQAPMPTPVEGGPMAGGSGPMTGVPFQVQGPVAGPGFVGDCGPGCGMGDVCCDAGPCCGAPGCCGLDCCCDPLNGRPSRVWARAEMLSWWMKDMPAVPLVTTTPDVPARSMAGVLGTSNILLGGHGLDMEDFLGGRFTLGVWLDRCQTLGLEGSYMFLGQRTNNFLAGSGGFPIFARPFFDTAVGPNAELVAYPGVIGGTVGVSYSSELNGVEANARYHLLDSCLWGWAYHVDLIAGFRYVELKEGLAVQENLTVAPGQTVGRLTDPLSMLSLTGPATIMVVDQFRTNNQFYGGQVGIDTEFRKDRWFVDLTEKFGVGTVHQSVDIGGSTAIQTFAPPLFTAAQGGLLAQPSNIGHYAQNRCGLLSEFGLKLGYQWNEHLRVFVGYDWLWMNHIIRPGNAINPVVNVSQAPTIFGPGNPNPVPREPSFMFRDGNFWAQGVTFGLELRY